MRLALLACLAAGCRIGFDPASGGAGSRKPITIAAGVSLADVPIAIMVNDAELATLAREDGRDLVFVAEDGAPLAFEIESYASGQLVAWVRVPDLQPVTKLYLEYGGALDQQNPPAVWAGYMGVWHLGETGSALDSTAHAHMLDGGPMPVPSTSAGIAGNARTFNGVDQQLAIADPVDGSLDVGTRSFTFSVWVHVAQSSGNFDTVLWKGGSSTTYPGYDMELGFNTWTTNLNDATVGSTTAFGVETTFLGKWTHLVTAVDRSTQMLTAYVNGTPIVPTNISSLGSIDNSEAFMLSPPTGRFHGDADELRIWDGAASADQIALEYRNLTVPQFVTVGPAESR